MKMNNMKMADEAIFSDTEAWTMMTGYITQTTEEYSDQLGTNYIYPFSDQWLLPYDLPCLIIRFCSLVFGQGNWLLIFCYCVCQPLNTPFNMLVVVMAAGDGIMSVVEVPLTILDVFRHYKPLNLNFLCSLKLVTKNMSYHCSLMCIAVIALVRYGQMCTKFKLTMKVARIMSATIFVLSLGVALLFALDNKSNALLVCTRKPTSRYGRMYFLVTAALACAAFCIIIVCYTAIYFKIYKHKQKMANQEHCSKINIMSTWMGCSISVVFIVCYLAPYTFLLIPLKIRKLPDVWHLIGLFDSLITVQLALNPILYFWGLASRRNILWESITVLTWCKRSHGDRDVNMVNSVSYPKRSVEDHGNDCFPQETCSTASSSPASETKASVEDSTHKNPVLKPSDIVIQVG